MLLGLLLPIAAVPVPPLTDYPNHLARALFLANAPHDAVMRRMFAARWALIPNLAVDLLLPPLMHVLPPLVAGRVIVALTVLLPTTGAVALSGVLFGQRSLWQLGAGFAAYNTMFLIGTLNFQLSAGIALWGAACWLRLRPRRPLLCALTGAAVATLAFLCHLFGFGFYAVLIVCAELSTPAPHPSGTWRHRLISLAALTAALAVPLELYVHTGFASSGGEVFWPSLGKKLTLLLVPVLAYSRALSIVTACALLAPPLFWLTQRRLAVAPMAPLAVLVLLTLYCALPVGAKGAYWLDTRVPVLLGFMLFATILPRAVSAAERRTVAAGLALLFILRMGFITLVWIRAQPEIAAVRAVLRGVTPGSSVLVVDGDLWKDPRGFGATPAHGFGGIDRHYGAFAFIDRDAFWSDAFTLPGQQPVVALPPYDQNGDGGRAPPPPYPALVAATDPRSADPVQFTHGWPGKFDDVLLLDAPAAPNARTLLPRFLTVAADSEWAILFKVKR